MIENKFNKAELLVFLIGLIATIIGIYYLGPSITGFVINEFSHEDDLKLVVTSSGNYTWQPKNIGDLKSVKLEGSVTNYGRAKVYLESNGIRHLIFDSTKLNESGKDKKNKKPDWIGANEFVVNGTALINLSQQFIDEDNDTLIYSASEVERLAISISGESATITATSNESFNTTIAFTASDGIGSKSHTVGLIIIVEEFILNTTEQANETNVTINITSITSANETKTIKINLAYNAGTIYDANDNGEESINGVVDLGVEGTSFNWNVDETKLCTRWEVYSFEDGVLTAFCNGNIDCCAFIGLSPRNANWSNLYYATFGKDGANYNNIIAGQVLYYDVNLSIGNIKSEIYYSEWGNLSVKFLEEEVQFFDECLDTCRLSGLNKSSYVLLFEIEDDAVLKIDKIKYDISTNSLNSPPVLLNNLSAINITKNKFAKINLSDYFSDPDGDVLTYDYYKPDNITILFDNEIAKVMPDSGFSGIMYTYLIANDSESIAVSNVFMINVSEVKLKAEETELLNKLAESLSVANDKWLFDNGNDFLGIQLYLGFPILRTNGYIITDNKLLPQFNITIPSNLVADIIENKTLQLSYIINFSRNIIDEWHQPSIVMKGNNYKFLKNFYCTVESGNETNITGLVLSQTPIIIEVIINNQSENISEALNITLSYNFSVDINAGSVIKCYDPIIVINPLSTNKLAFNFSIEQLNVSAYANANNRTILIPYLRLINLTDRFGWVFNSTEINRTLNLLSISWNKKLYYQIDSTENYTPSRTNPYLLERPLGYCKNVTNQIGQVECKNVKRFISFEDIFKKENNLFDKIIFESTVCLDPLCVNTTRTNFSRKEKRDIDFRFIQQKTNWIVEFFNLFDLDPSFIDDTDTNWNLGTFVNMVTQGTGVGANLTSGQNISGSFTSQIFDAGAVANWTNITWSVEAPYGEELPNNAVDVAWGNMSGNVVLFHFNNQSEYGENNSQVYDFSGNKSNGTIIRAFYNDTSLLGGKGLTLSNDITSSINLSDKTEFSGVPINNLTIMVWLNSKGLADNGQIANKVGPASNSEEYDFAANSDGSLSFIGRDCLGGTVIWSRTGALKPLKNNTWHHIALIWKGVDATGGNYAVIYVDGVNYSNYSSTTTGLCGNTASHFGIGSNIGQGSNNGINATLDEFAMFTRALETHEIVQHYKRGAMRLNLSARSCDDSSCTGELWQRNISINGTSGRIINLNLSSTNRYFQYNFSYSNNATDNLVVNNVSIEYVLKQNYTFTMLVNTTDRTNFTFDDGILNQTFFNTTIGAIQLVEGNSNGTYLSQVFDLGTTQQWLNVSWIEGVPYGEELPPNQDIETVLNGVNMTNATVLFHFNNQSAFGENDSQVYDFSGHGNNGSVHNTAFYNYSGAFGYGMDLISTNGNNLGSINVTDKIELSGVPVNNITIMMWMRKRNSSDLMNILSKAIPGSAAEYFLYTTSNINFQTKTCAGGTLLNPSTPAGSIKNETWHHIAIVWQGVDAANYVVIYIDGVNQTNKSTTTTGACGDGAGPLIIGTRTSENAFPFNGTIDEFAFFSRALQTDEIKNAYLRGAARLNISVRSCDDSACSGDLYLTNATNSSKTTLAFPNNRYLQYQANYFSFAGNATPELYNVTIHYQVPATTCACPASGDWNITCGDNCVITSDCNMNGNNIYAAGTGSLDINALIYNVNNIFIHSGCNVFCRRQAGCFG